jgi:hypothetical protein
MLASASQDYFIRIWRFSQRTVEDNVVNSVKDIKCFSVDHSLILEIPCKYLKTTTNLLF